MRYCGQCGSEEDGAFCRFCGSSLAQATPATEASGAGPTAPREAPRLEPEPEASSYTQPLGLVPGAVEPPPDGHPTVQIPADPYFPAALPEVGGIGYEPNPYTAPLPAPFEPAPFHPGPEPPPPAWTSPAPPATDVGYDPSPVGYGDPALGATADRGGPDAGRPSRALPAVLGVLTALLIGLGVWWLTSRRDTTNEVTAPTQAPTQATTPVTASSPATPPSSAQGQSSTGAAPTSAGTTAGGTATAGTGTAASTGPGMAALEAARLELVSARDAGYARAKLDGHWGAQLASKYDGIVDPIQVTETGGHTFGLADISSEHRRLKDRFGEDVILLNGTDFGKQVARRDVVWVTLYDGGGFSSSAAVNRWCEAQFPDAKGRARANSCVPRQLRRPYR